MYYLEHGRHRGKGIRGTAESAKERPRKKVTGPGTPKKRAISKNETLEPREARTAGKLCALGKDQKNGAE